jgi:hypothetical protein
MGGVNRCLLVGTISKYGVEVRYATSGPGPGRMRPVCYLKNGKEPVMADSPRIVDAGYWTCQQPAHMLYGYWTCLPQEDRLAVVRRLIDKLPPKERQSLREALEADEEDWL